MIRHVARWKQTVFLVVLMLLISRPAAGDSAAELVRESGVKGGLVVHVGGGSAAWTAALRVSPRYLVQGIERDADRVAKARAVLRDQGKLGGVTVIRWQGKRLPYADNLVNLLIDTGAAGKIAKEEILRVLVPGGVALVGGERTVKPWPAEIDEWTHFLHDASGNAVARDSRVGPPRNVQWIGGPVWSRSHEYDSSLSAMVSSRGRVFYIFDEGPTGIIDKRVPDKWMLIARDAFNGVVLWKRPIADWGWKAWKRAQMEKADWRRMGSQRHVLPLSAARRLVADGDRVYVTLGYHAALTALDAVTGQTKLTYPDTQRTDEIVHRDGLLVLCIRAVAEPPRPPARKKRRPRGQIGPAVLVGVKADTGQRLWRTKPTPVVPLSTALTARGVFFHDGSAVVCLDAASGKQRWRTPAGGAGNSIWNTDTTLVVYKGVVLCAGQKQLVALAVADGKPLWKLPGARGFGAASPPDLFVADGLVWYGQGGVHGESIIGYDPLTGKPARTVALGGVITRGHHARCYRSKATDKYLLLPKRAVEMIDLKGGRHSRHNWVRGACRYGVLPCNGLLYSTPHPCFCYAGVKLGGFMALSAGAAGEPAADKTPRLTRGPAYAEISSRRAGIKSPASAEASAGKQISEGDWPMYRHDARRSGSTSSVVDRRLRRAWRARLGGKLTQPVVVGKRLFLARVNAGQVCCLDAATGRPIWDYVVGGRVDSAPTYYKGRLLFGSADGYVYCLRASDGVLAWRMRAARSGRQVVAMGRVESAWPVHGSVLVMKDLVYFAAGRSSFLDGGIVLFAVDPLTGEAVHGTRLEGPLPNTKNLDENAYAMEGAKSDILVTDGRLIYLFHNAFNARLVKQPTPVKGAPGVRNLGVREFGQHLFSNAGFLDDSWFSRNHWIYANRWPGFNFGHQSPKAGQIVVFDDTHTYAVKCFVRRNMLSPLFFPATDGYFLVADRNDNQPVVVSGKNKPKYIRWLPQTGTLQTCWNLDVGFARSKPAKWVSNIPVRVRAMVRTGNALFVAGLPDVCDLASRKGATLRAVSADDGKTLAELKLDAPPVFDGLMAAGGCLFMSTTDGQVICFRKDR